MACWRLLSFETYNAYMNMAIDEAVLMARIKGVVPNTVRFYRWSPSAVAIGKFQNVEREVHLENCRKHGVDVVRRITGGGAVYLDAAGELTYSVVAGKDELKVRDAAEAYAKIYSGIVQALKILGLEADFNEGFEGASPNLTVRGRKISGSAQCHRAGVILQHGTLLLDVDFERMFTFLKVPWGETLMEVVNFAKKKITSVKAELGREVSPMVMHQALVEGFQKALKTQLQSGELTPYEKENVEKLCKEKYSSLEWNLRGRSPI